MQGGWDDATPPTFTTNPTNTEARWRNKFPLADAYMALTNVNDFRFDTLLQRSGDPLRIEASI